MTENIIKRIQKLMERALHESTPQHEAEACMAKADALMAQHMIDREQVNAADPSLKSRVTSQTWDVDLYGGGGEFYSTIYSLLFSTLTHCGLKAAPSKNYKAYTVVGYPEDIAYAERMWFRIFFEFVSKIAPSWDAEKEVGENIHAHLQAGFKWPQIWKRAHKAGQHPVDPYSGKSEGKRLGRWHKEWLAANGIEWQRHTQTHQAYRNSYASSFRGTIANRLHEMRTGSEEVVGRDKFLLARQSTEADVEAEFYRLYPDLDPENIRKEQERREAMEAERLAAMTPQEIAAERAAQEKARKIREKRARAEFGSYRRSSAKTYDPAGWASGQKAAKNVNLHDFKEAGHKKKEID